MGRVTMQEVGGDTLVLDDKTALARLQGVTGVSVGLVQPFTTDFDTNLAGVPAARAGFEVIVSVYPTEIT